MLEANIIAERDELPLEEEIEKLSLNTIYEVNNNIRSILIWTRLLGIYDVAAVGESSSSINVNSLSFVPYLSLFVRSLLCLSKSITSTHEGECLSLNIHVTFMLFVFLRFMQLVGDPIFIFFRFFSGIKIYIKFSLFK